MEKLPIRKKEGCDQEEANCQEDGTIIHHVIMEVIIRFNSDLLFDLILVQILICLKGYNCTIIIDFDFLICLMYLNWIKRNLINHLDINVIVITLQ